jgi:hypothetical protein
MGGSASLGSIAGAILDSSGATVTAAQIKVVSACHHGLPDHALEAGSFDADFIVAGR